MLRPQDNGVRERKLLNGLWSFRVDRESVGRQERWADEPLQDARQLAVPASYNDSVVDARARLHVGSVWYETVVWIPRGRAGKRVIGPTRRDDAEHGDARHGDVRHGDARHDDAEHDDARHDDADDTTERPGGDARRPRERTETP